MTADLTPEDIAELRRRASFNPWSVLHNCQLLALLDRIESDAQRITAAERAWDTVTAAKADTERQLSAERDAALAEAVSNRRLAEEQLGNANRMSRKLDAALARAEALEREVAELKRQVSVLRESERNLHKGVDTHLAGRMKAEAKVTELESDVEFRDAAIRETADLTPEDSGIYGKPCHIAPAVGGVVDDRNAARCWHEGGLWHDITPEQERADKIRYAVEKARTFDAQRIAELQAKLDALGKPTIEYQGHDKRTVYRSEWRPVAPDEGSE